MGYYVHTTAADFFIAREDFDRAYQLLVDLNRRDELKSGHCYPAHLERPGDSKSVAANPNVWFSWMPWNYDEVYGDAVEILEAVGFDLSLDETGIVDISYDDKTGCEKAFLSALAPVVAAGSFIKWQGEEPADSYTFAFVGERMEVCY